VDEVGPVLEVNVVGDAALERDVLVLRLAGALAVVRRVAALAVHDGFGRARERAHLGEARHVAAVPLESEIAALIRIVALRVDGELGHR